MPRKTMSLMEEQEAIKRILPDDPVFNPEFVYFVLANLVRETFLSLDWWASH